MAIVYINGRFIPDDKANISIFDRGFLFGDGFFETIRCQNGKILFLEDHINRLLESCKEFQITIPNIELLHSIIIKLLAENHLTNSIASAKIIITRGITPTLYITPVDTPTIIVIVRSYKSHPDSLYKTGCYLVPYPYPRHSFLSKHKSLNYLFYIKAHSFARQNGTNDAIILDPDDCVLECSISNIIIYQDSKIIACPHSMNILPGVTQKIVLEFLKTQGYDILLKPFKLENLYSAQEVIITNSLILAMPVNRIGETFIRGKTNISRLLREYFFNTI